MDLYKYFILEFSGQNLNYEYSLVKHINYLDCVDCLASEIIYYKIKDYIFLIKNFFNTVKTFNLQLII